jgi:hypothetical protein
MYRPKSGELLPYLCDRSDQEIALDNALQYHRGHTPRRPFLTIIHGDEYQCHDMFKQRLRDISLPKLIRITAEQGGIQDFMLHRPSSYVKHYNLVEILRKDLSEELVGKRDASIDEILSAFSHCKAPIMVSLYLNYEDWSSTGRHLLDAYIKLWLDLPDLPPMRLLCCLFFTYKRTEDLGLLSRWRYSRLNQQIRDHLNGIDFVKYGGLHGVVLPELHAVPQTDAEDWLRDNQNFRGFCDIHTPEFCNVQKSIEELRDVYSRSTFRTSDGRIPMQPLADELRKLLKVYKCHGRS